MTLAEKLLAIKAGKKKVEPGEFLLLDVDVALANDITAPIAIKKFKEYGGIRVHDPSKIVLVPDHFVPNKDIKSAMQVKMLRDFAQEQGITNFFEVGRMGIEHVLLPEEGIVKSGDLVVGADSHTCTYGALCAFATGVGSTDIAGVYLTGKVWLKVPETILVKLKGKFKEFVTAKDLILKLISILGVNGANYKVLEFSGPALENISMDGRFTISNMAIEAGGKTGLFPVDDLTIAYEEERGIDVEPMEADEDAKYYREVELELSQLEPQVAYPFLPSNTRSIGEAEKEKIKVDQVVIGSCTNGRMEDLRIAAEILKGRKVAPHVRCIVIPGSQKIMKEAIKEGLIDTFLEAECAVSTPTCGPCLGGHMGILAAGEVALSTTNRNFVGRMGHPESKVFLASPAVAAATAVKGYIADP
ncbi:MAG: 3-isopropylmalate dehydratase large subunit, partial [Thermotogae bacterium]|nr:3-isopropylmalate dehydratase large subunit [Thermotogota bacterium]